MKINDLNKIEKLYFGYEEIGNALAIKEASAKVAASRYVKQGLLLRMKRNMYLLRNVWNTAGQDEKLLLANLGQVPSYVSLATALDFHQITTQIQRDFFESVAMKRTKEIHLDSTVFRYVKIARPLYFGFNKVKGIFIATPEKAFLDAFYLLSLGRYALDISALDTEKLDRKEIRRLSKKFPSNTRRLLKRDGYL